MGYETHREHVRDKDYGKSNTIIKKSTLKSIKFNPNINFRETEEDLELDIESNGGATIGYIPSLQYANEH